MMNGAIIMAGISIILLMSGTIFAVLSGIILMIITGMLIVSLGLGGGIAASALVNNKRIKIVLIQTFTAVILLGTVCMSPLLAAVNMPFSIWGFIIPAAGILIIALGVTGIINALKLEHKILKIILTAILSIVSGMGLTLLTVSLVVFLLFR